jgi:hypothetical protein
VPVTLFVKKNQTSKDYYSIIVSTTGKIMINSDKDYPIASYAAALSGDHYHAGFTSDDIVASEKQGQLDLVGSTQLPAEGDWDILEGWGVQRVSEASGLFVDAVLPAGWTKVATDSSLWSDLKDQHGRIRALVFYKAAWYDQSAKISAVKRRFNAVKNFDNDRGIVPVVLDSAKNQDIYKGEGGRFAFLSTEPALVGYVIDDKFWTKPEQTSGSWQFTSCVPASEATLLIGDEIYKKYHHISPIHEMLDAADSKSMESSEIFCAAFYDAIAALGKDEWSIDDCPENFAEAIERAGKAVADKVECS